jgi:carbon monoxide dehydrogenase subunit G
MQFEKTVRVEAPLAEIWNFLWDYQRVYSCIRGCKKVEVIEDRRKYMGFVEEKVGPFKVNFAIDIEVVSVEGFAVKVKAVGKDSKIVASLRQHMEFELKEISQKESELHFKTEVNIFGKLATLGHWLIRKKADDIMEYFVSCMKAELEKKGVN